MVDDVGGRGKGALRGTLTSSSFLADLAHAAPHSPLTPLRQTVVFFSFYSNNGKDLGAPLDWVLFCFVAVLPSVGFLWVAYMRRERALDELAKGGWWVGVLPPVVAYMRRKRAPDELAEGGWQLCQCMRVGVRRRRAELRISVSLQGAGKEPLAPPSCCAAASPCGRTPAWHQASPPRPSRPSHPAVRVLMTSIFTAHRDWVPPALRPDGQLEAVQVDVYCTKLGAGASQAVPVLMCSEAYDACLPTTTPACLLPACPQPRLQEA